MVWGPTPPGVIVEKKKKKSLSPDGDRAVCGVRTTLEVDVHEAACRHRSSERRGGDGAGGGRGDWGGGGGVGRRPPFVWGHPVGASAQEGGRRVSSKFEPPNCLRA